MHELGIVEVIEIDTSGDAAQMGIKVGVVVINVGNMNIDKYDEAMEVMKSRSSRFEIVFRRLFAATIADEKYRFKLLEKKKKKRCVLGF